MDGQKSLYSCGFSPFRASFPLTDAISGVLETRLGALGDRIGKLLFKMAVEESMMMRLLAMDESLTFSELEPLRKWAIQTVRNTDGGLNFDDILRIQQ